MRTLTNNFMANSNALGVPADKPRSQSVPTVTLAENPNGFHIILTPPPPMSPRKSPALPTANREEKQDKDHLALPASKAYLDRQYQKLYNVLKDAFKAHYKESKKDFFQQLKKIINADDISCDEVRIDGLIFAAEDYKESESSVCNCFGLFSRFKVRSEHGKFADVLTELDFSNISDEYISTISNKLRLIHEEAILFAPARK